MYVTFFGDRRGTLPAGWAKETIVSFLGDARIDASAGAGPGARVTFVALAGDAVIRVPPRQQGHRRRVQPVRGPQDRSLARRRPRDPR